MLRIEDTLNGEPISFNYCQNAQDAREALDFVQASQWLSLDTEATHFNPYLPGWQLRTFQFGDGSKAYILPARAHRSILKVLRACPRWVGHNGPHDIRCLDVHLGQSTGIVCAGETYIPAHHRDSRKQDEGGWGHGLKELATRYVSREAGKWERALFDVFNTLKVPIEGEVYKSGPRKGTQKYRKARRAECWGLIDPEHPAYLTYAGSDPILTSRLWLYLAPGINAELYHFDHRVQQACDVLYQRGIALDVAYTTRLRDSLFRRAQQYMRRAAELGCTDIFSGPKVAHALLDAGARLTAKTDTGKWKTTNRVLEGQILRGNDHVQALCRAILMAKRCDKRAKAYADAMLRTCDINGRVHPSINSLGARTSRMSVTDPALQQLPTKDAEHD